MCLYESLTDFLSDLVVLDGSDSNDDELVALYQRINTGAMDCLGDIEPLSAILRSIRKSFGDKPPLVSDAD